MTSHHQRGDRAEITLEINILLESGSYVDGTPGRLRVFLPSSEAPHPAEDSRTFPCNSGEPATAKLWVPTSMHENVPILVWWMPERKMLGELHLETKEARESDSSSSSSSELAAQSYQSSFAACGRITLSRLSEPRPAAPLLNYIGDTIGVLEMHITAVPVGTVTFAAERKEPWLQPAEVTSATRKHTELTEAKLRVSATAPSGTNITSCLAPASFHEITLPVGVVPTWSFPLFVYRSAVHRANAPNSIQLVQRLYELSVFSMRLRAEEYKTWSLDTHLELYCEMLTVASRHALYVKDGSLRNGVEQLDDEWNYTFADGFDCEDGTAWALAIDTLLKHCTRLSPEVHHLMGKVKAIGYTAMFCIGALKLAEGKYTYHAFLLQLPILWLASQLSTTTPSPKEEKQIRTTAVAVDRKSLPCPLIIESTAWATGNWKYEDAAVTESSYRRGHRMAPVECLPKVAPSLLKSLYTHVQLGFLPSMIDSSSGGITRVAFRQGGKLGASVIDLMEGRFWDHRVIHSIMKVGAHDVAAAMAAYDCMPRMTLPIAAPLTEPAIVYLRRAKSVHETVPLIDVCYRYKDWGPEIQARLAKEYSGCSDFEITSLRIGAELRGIRVRGW